jgi:hypothetical protein
MISAALRIAMHVDALKPRRGLRLCPLKMKPPQFYPQESRNVNGIRKAFSVCGFCILIVAKIWDSAG